MGNYKVIEDFTDLTNNRIYKKGQVYPAKGLTASEDRLSELSTPNNKRGKAVITLVEQKVKKTSQEVKTDESTKEAEETNQEAEVDKPEPPKKDTKKQPNKAKS